MFRKFGFILTTTLLGVMPAAAQDVKPVQLTIGGGYTSVLGPVRDHVANGGNFTIGVLFNTQSPLSFQAEYGWNGMMKKQIDLNVSQLPTGGGTPTPFYADGNMQYFDGNFVFEPKTPAKAAGYGIVGLGYYHRPVNVTTPGVGYTTVCDPWWYVCYPALVPVDQVVGERSSNDFGMNFGGGVNFKVSNSASIFFEIRYHYIWGPTITQSQVPAGQTPSSLKANGQFLPITAGFRF
jgi:opacity protein-like surface antigen